MRSRRGEAAALYLPFIGSVSATLTGRSFALVPSALVLAAVSITIAIRQSRSPFADFGVFEDEESVACARFTIGSCLFYGLLLSLPVVSFDVGFLGSYRHGQTAHARGRAREIRNAVHRWRGGFGTQACPTVKQLIDDREVDPNEELVDAWGSAYRIRCEGEDVHVESPGGDRKLGTEDDVIVGSPGPDRKLGTKDDGSH